MAENRNYAALEWVIGEIEETLKQAQQALEAYVESPEDSTRIRFCLTHIHQVHGSLLMVEFSGAALLAQEMESLAQALMDHKTVNQTEALEVLMRAILQLPVYLEQAKATRKDEPTTLLSLLNDLRAVRGQRLLSETRLFGPDLSAAKEVTGNRSPALKNGNLKAMLKKLRQMYQYAAAGYIRNVNTAENLSYLNKVFTRLDKLTQGSARNPLWRIMVAVGEALEQGDLKSSFAFQMLLRQLDKEIKALALGGVAAFDGFNSEALTKNFLYYVSSSESESDRARALRDKYGISQALPEAQFSSSQSLVDPETMQTVVAALKDEMETIKHALDVGISGSDHTAVDEALPVMRRVADTLEILGIGDLREQVLKQIGVLNQFVDAQDPPADLLMRIASEMIAMEQRLTAMTAAASRSVIGGSDADKGARLEIGHAQEAVLIEARNDLEKAKDAIIEFIASQWDVSHLRAVPNLLNETRGGLSMIPLARPSAILQSCSNYVQRELIENGVQPEWGHLDTLADAISSVEYYLERLTGDAGEDDETLMEVAESSVASLGYPVSGYKAIKDRSSVSNDASAEDVLKKISEVESVEIDSLPSAEAEAEAPSADETAVDSDVTPIEMTLAEELADIDFSGEDVVEVILEADVDGATAVDVVDTGAIASERNDEDVSEKAPNQIDEDPVDDEILEIFVEEAGEVLLSIDENFPKWARDFENRDALGEFRRAFHTLKGSGRMVKASDISELAWAIESMLNRVMDSTIEPHSAQASLITLVRELLPDLITAFESKTVTPHLDRIDQLKGWAEELSKGNVPAQLVPANELNNAEPDFTNKPSGSREALKVTALAEEDTEEEHAILWGIFASEAETHLNTVNGFISDMDQASPLFLPPSESLQRALHTLKGSAHMADVVDVAQLATPLERFVKELRTYLVNIDSDILQLLKDAVSYIEDVIAQIRGNDEVSIPKLAQFIARVAELKDRSVGPMIRQREQAEAGSKKVDPELLSIFMAEAMDLLLDVDQILDHWQQQPSDTAKFEPLIDELNTLANGAEHASLPPMEQLSRQLAQVYRSTDGQLDVFTDGDFSLLQDVHEQLLDMVDAVAAGQNLQPLAAEQQAQLDTLIENLSQSAQVLEAEPVADNIADTAELPTDIAQEFINAVADDATVIPEETFTKDSLVESADKVFVESKEEAQGYELPEDMDLEIVEIFTEEADELMEEVEQFVGDWEADWTLTEPLEELKRVLHTLKGGARLAGMMGLGDIAHNLETFLINLSDNNRLSEAFFREVHQYQDALLRGVDRVKGLAAGESVDLRGVVSIVDIKELSDSEPDSTPETPKPAALQGGTTDISGVVDSGKVVPFKPNDNVPVVSSGDAAEAFHMPAPAQDNRGVNPVGSGPSGTSALAAKRSAPQEIVKVSAELLEELVNLAGETSISRGRTEEQLSEMGFTLEEMDSTIVRLQEQLRRLDIETEAQVLFRQEQMQESDDFDPLEMDRYTHLQQLSRSLIESASDLLDLKSTMSNKTRDTETLLLQQSRINTELQEGLMRSRMVQFSRLVPRLRRIVRQVASELDKKVSFELDNVEGELDRTVLERMVAPLEHMLRNAVDHGIESPEDRIAVGKPETGRIVLTLGREGGDVILRLIDDGRGISLERVREKAIERGLMTDDAGLSDRDIMQFILHAGFSTAEAVTQISGRGVGLDVVHSEIKQLGGAMSINSVAGQGTEFTVRLPFTVSVNRALMVRIGDDRYAIPLNTIEGIVRVSPFELEHYYQNEESRFEYAGERYQVRYLGEMLHSDVHPKLEGQAMPLPVVLVRSPQHTVAVQVDMLMGSREIVVKSLGSQFSQVQGLSGATVMGDGSVVVILDPHALIRKDAMLEYTPYEALTAPVEAEGVTTVMVVDDSVTVRKVTSRFLEREGYEVITAKDGADALLLLQDRVPDVMLLDIEMPRMDGFEVAKNVRSSSRWKEIPIIMITSRTGDKHREHALSLGVNLYMGKPYQEEILLENIQALIKTQ